MRKRKNYSPYRQIYGLSQREIAEKFQVSCYTVMYHHQRGTLNERIENAWRKIDRYKEEFGMTSREIALRLKLSRERIRQLRNAGRLADAIKANGTVRQQRKTSDCKYRRKYGLSITELARNFKCSGRSVSMKEASGVLAKMFSRGKGVYFVPHERLIRA